MSISRTTPLLREQRTWYYTGGVVGRVRCTASRCGTPGCRSRILRQRACPSRTCHRRGSADHSTTNVQVAGVDEPDFVKNDGKYIYVITGQTLAIVDAYPAASASVMSRTEIADTPRDIFIDGNRLVLFVTGTEDTDTISSGGSVRELRWKRSMPYYYRNTLPVTHAVFYDISDRAHPKVLKDYTIDGDYIDARLIGSNLYLVTREQVYTYEQGPDHRARHPGRDEDGDRAGCLLLRQPRTPVRLHHGLLVRHAGRKGEGGKDLPRGQRRHPVCLGERDVHHVPEVPQHLPPDAGRAGHCSLMMACSGSRRVLVRRLHAPVLWEDFNRMSESEKQEYIAEMKNAEQESIRKKEIDQTTTVIHKIAISNGAITYIARGEVPGILESQFSMDEYKNNLRVATTSNVYTTRGSYEYNNVFVLDSGMKTIGSLTHIAEQEKIYSTRFIGDRLYMVTFKRIDPFFVIDLSTPTAPKILGKLKIPGYSDYLHPYDATHIIGIGKETGTNDWGGVSTKGIKLALFDVSDVEHPKQIDKVEIGDAGSDSAALSDHKAFLFDKAKNLLVIPARVVKNER